MDKKEFLNSFTDKEQVSMVSSLYDKIFLCNKTGKTTYSNEFLTPNLWQGLKALENKLGVNIELKGLFPQCERKLASFYIDEKPEEFPFKLLKILNKSKFRTLEHRDYLGSLMALGIKREKLGDLIIHGNCAYIVAHRDVSDYILYSLEEAANCPCEVSESFIEELGEDILKKDSINVIATSLRIDSIVSSLGNISRSKANEIISRGKVLVNYKEVTKKDKIVDMEDTITIRGVGKFILKEILGTTQRDRIKVRVEKYS